jgi:TRAP-type C4-dicarboxylate transport system substrate-binding protein
MAVTYSSPSPAMRYFMDRVAALSDGNVRIEGHYEWGSFTPPAEQEVVRAVTAGTVDLGDVAVRAFDTLGVKSLQALTAPLLIDSYELQTAVLRSDIPKAMLHGLGRVRVEGLAMLAGGLLKPIAERPLLTPLDWRGLTFATFMSNSEMETLRALGATPKVAFGSFRWQGLASGEIQAWEWPLESINDSAAWIYPSHEVTANVNLWPWIDVIVANPARLASLTPEQRGWLAQAAREASDRSPSLLTPDADLLSNLCAHDVRFGTATEADLAQLRLAFAPIYARMERDSQTRAFITQIEALKRATPLDPPLVIPAGCAVMPQKSG